MAGAARWAAHAAWAGHSCGGWPKSAWSTQVDSSCLTSAIGAASKQGADIPPSPSGCRPMSSQAYRRSLDAFVAAGIPEASILDLRGRESAPSPLLLLESL